MVNLGHGVAGVRGQQSDDRSLLTGFLIFSAEDLEVWEESPGEIYHLHPP